MKWRIALIIFRVDFILEHILRLVYELLFSGEDSVMDQIITAILISLGNCKNSSFVDCLYKVDSFMLDHFSEQSELIIVLPVEFIRLPVFVLCIVGPSQRITI